MRTALLPTDGVQIQLAAPVTASVPAARIEVESVSPLRLHQARLRLACSEPRGCLPFFATVTYPDAVDVSSLHTGPGQTVPSVRKPQSSVGVAEAERSVKTEAMKDAAILHAGSKATLEFEADRIHVRIEVISLQSGAAGSRVRVSSVDHKQIYTAEVITPTILRGELSK